MDTPTRLQARRMESDSFAAQLEIPKEALWAAANAVWSNLGPQQASFTHALSLAGVALRAADLRL